MGLVSKVVCVCYLGMLSVADIRKRTLPLWLLGAGIVLAAAYRGFEREEPAALWVSGAAAGMLFLLVSKITKEALGYGDSVLIGILGIYLGIWELFCLLLTAFFLAAIYAVVLLMKRRFRKKMTFPFVPFLEAAYVIMLTAGR